MSQVFFRKEREDDDSVVYAFGEDHENFTRTLTIDTGSGRWAPDDDVVDRTFRKASWGIAAGRRRQGRWPERGSHTSG